MGTEKAFLLGNEAVARGLYEAGVKVVSSYPGTPSTEITEAVVQYREIYSEWAPNEKVAFEVAFGASVAGARSFSAMKHVGLNVAADPLYTAAYTGVNGGLVIAVADDPGMHSSQNEQDSRYHAIASKVPMLEPSDSAECLEYTKLAFDLSEKFDTPIIIRLSTRISHTRSVVTLSERIKTENKPYVKNVAKNVMMPAMARARHKFVEERQTEFADWSESSGINKIEYNNKKIGVICAGTTYVYAREALGGAASYLKLGAVNPLPEKIIKEFASKVETLYVIEELDPIIETHCKKIGIDVIGKSLFPICGEFSQGLIKKLILGTQNEAKKIEAELPGRPPVLCAGCPHRGLYTAIKKFKPYVSGDIGCYTLGAGAPLSMIDVCLCMGASISALHGYNKATDDDLSKKSLAVIGDSTFIHSGITGLIDVVYNKGISTVIILDNSITGMTGHQNNPANGFRINGDATSIIDLEALARAIGIKRVFVVDPFDIKATELIIETELNTPEPSLIISRKPCALLKTADLKPALRVDENNCIGCKKCLSVGCPAISISNGKAVINATQCVGCTVCASVCPKKCIGD